MALADGSDALVIDGGRKQNSEALFKAIREATGASRIKYLFNTHWHPEQTGLNERAGKDHATIIAHEQTAMYLGHRAESTLFSGYIGPLAKDSQPTEHPRGDGSLDFGGQHIEYGYLPAAHTNGDLYVYFPGVNLLVAGGAAGSDAWPLIDYRNGAFIGGLVRGYEKLAGIGNAQTVVVPAHGRTMTGTEVATQRDMYQKLFVDLNAWMNKGMGYDDIVDINPLHGYEAQFGDPSVFLDGAYRSMEMAYVRTDSCAYPPGPSGPGGRPASVTARGDRGPESDSHPPPADPTSFRS